MDRKINVTIYNENFHETENPDVRAIYPGGIHGCIRDFLSKDAAVGNISRGKGPALERVSQPPHNPGHWNNLRRPPR
jgi:hypothetical protein